MRLVMVVVDSRATWSRALTVCEAIQGRDDLELQLVLIGPLADRSGMIIDDFLVDQRMPPMGETMAAQVSNHIAWLAYLIGGDHPDIVVSVTDRYESFAVATAAALSNTHLAHIQGGEVSGSLDESMRHAITKLAHIHFPANQDSAERIIKLGEAPEYVFNVGCPATDLLLKVDVREPPIGEPPLCMVPYALVNYNPVTTETPKANGHAARHLLDACRLMCQQAKLRTIVIGPNHDPGHEAITEAIHAWSPHRGSWMPGYSQTLYSSVTHPDFIRLMAHAAVMVGNSSAGIREACYFGTPVVDVGIRQQGRACSANVLMVQEPTIESIRKAIASQLAHGLYPPEQPFGNGGAGEKIAELLATMDLPPIQKRIRY